MILRHTRFFKKFTSNVHLTRNPLKDEAPPKRERVDQGRGKHVAQEIRGGHRNPQTATMVRPGGSPSLGGSGEFPRAGLGELRESEGRRAAAGVST